MQVEGATVRRVIGVLQVECQTNNEISLLTEKLNKLLMKQYG
jgi:hypothetical protein